MIREKSLKRLLEESDNEKEVGRHWHRRIISLGIAEWWSYNSIIPSAFISFPEELFLSNSLVNLKNRFFRKNRINIWFFLLSIYFQINWSILSIRFLGRGSIKNYGFLYIWGVSVHKVLLVGYWIVLYHLWDT